MTDETLLEAPVAVWEELRRDLLSTPDVERAAVGFAGADTVNSRPRLLLRDWLPVPADEYLVQSAAHLEVSPVFWARAAKRAKETGEAIIIAHSHPRDGQVPTFSLSDDAGEAALIPKLQARASVPVMATVVSPGGVRLRLIQTSGAPAHAALHLVGQPRDHGSLRHGSMRFDRQIRALGQQGHALLGALTIGVVGAGGIGSHVIQQLFHLGVGHIVVLDNDRVALSNLSRLVGATRMDVRLRRKKVGVARRLNRRLGSPTSVTALDGSVTDAANALRLRDCDLVIGCTDNHWSRMVLNGLAFQYYIPVLDLGVELQSTGSLGGRVAWLAPGSACLWCLSILDGDRVRAEQLPPAIREHDLARGYISDIDEPAPAVVSINGVIASLAVTELLARFTGFAGLASRPNLLLYRIAEGDVRRVATTPRADCPTCSVRGVLGLGELRAAPWLGE